MREVRIMDAFVNVLKDFSNQIIPILGAVCLICLIVFLIKLIKLLGNVEITVTKTNGTIDLVDESIEKIQAPLDTVVKLSDTIDKAHGATLDATKEVKDFVTKTTTDVNYAVGCPCKPYLYCFDILRQRPQYIVFYRQILLSEQYPVHNCS